MTKRLEEKIQKIQTQLGNEISKLRKQSLKTQDELAQLMGTTKPYISKVEQGKQNVSVEFLIRVAEALGKEIDITIY